MLVDLFKTFDGAAVVVVSVLCIAAIAIVWIAVRRRRK